MAPPPSFLQPGAAHREDLPIALEADYFGLAWRHRHEAASVRERRHFRVVGDVAREPRGSSAPEGCHTAVGVFAEESTREAHIQDAQLPDVMRPSVNPP